MKTKPEQKRKEECKKLKDLLLQKRNICKLEELIGEYNAYYNLSEKECITEGRIRNAILYSCGEIYKSSDGYYTVGHVLNYNGLSGNSVTTLCKLQRDVCAFPNPFIYRINEKVLMLEVKPKFADKAKYLLNKTFTKRYIYDIILHGNQLIIFLLNENERDSCNKGRDKKTCRTDKYSQVELGDKIYCNPHLEGVTADQELTCEQIIQMLKHIINI